jgi:hypothetical protein
MVLRSSPAKRASRAGTVAGDLLDGGVLVALGLEEAQRRGLDGAAQLDLLAFP